MNFNLLWQKYLIHVIDILLISYILYKFLSFIKDTRAMRILLGLVFLFLFTLIVVYVLKLPITSWVLQKFWLTGVVLLAIVFQPEIRSALSEFYIPTKVFNPKKIVFVEEIISAVKEFTETKTGSLIVIEGSVGLKNFVATGVILNADVSKELLISIFHKGNILHDGAVIISKNKILAARCILPLSEELNLKNYGTRHRAADGIARITDATVIVTSEETGKISFFKNKKMETNLSLEQLREKINKEVNNIT
jgi:diadenylate cyclase